MLLKIGGDELDASFFREKRFSAVELQRKGGVSVFREEFVGQNKECSFAGIVGDKIGDSF